MSRKAEDAAELAFDDENIDYIRFDYTHNQKNVKVAEFVKIFGTKTPDFKNETLPIELIIHQEAKKLLAAVGNTRIRLLKENRAKDVKLLVEGKNSFNHAQRHSSEASEATMPSPTKISFDNPKKRKIAMRVGPPIKYEAPDFYEQIETTVKVPDREILFSVPYICDNIDDNKLIDHLKTNFFDIHGFTWDKHEVSDQTLFLLMKECLKRIKPEDADVFYYALYRAFPNRGSQRTHSERFSQLCRKFDRSCEISEFEPWKHKESAVFSSHGNYFKVSLKLPSGTKTCARCYNKNEFGKIDERKTEHPGKDSTIDLYLQKHVSSSLDDNHKNFLHKLFSKGDEIVDLCEFTKKHQMDTNCLESFKMLQSLHPTFVIPTITDFNFKKSYQIRRAEYKACYASVLAELKKESEEKLEKAKKEQRSFQEIKSITDQYKSENYDWVVRPCSHFGPCGPDNSNCACIHLCTEQCQCDIDCPRRFHGCRCKPGTCHTSACQCAVNKVECVKGLCSTCLVNEDTDSSITEKCKNFAFQRNDGCGMISVGESDIAGWGAILKKDVKKKQFLGEYVGEHISESESDRRGLLYEFSTNYLFGLTRSQGSVDSTLAGNETRFINHADKPNSVTYVREVNGTPRIGFFAKVDMKAGTELTFDYKYSKEHREKCFQMTVEQRVEKSGLLQQEKESQESDSKPKTSTRTRKRKRTEKDDVKQEFKKKRKCSK